jgi:hypothetical protein
LVHPIALPAARRRLLSGAVPAYGGTASGIINAGSAVVGIVSPILFWLMIDRTGNRTAPFIGSIALLPPGALIVLLIRPDGRLEMVAKSPLPAVVRTPLGTAG